MISDEQAGFRNGFSTTDNALILDTLVRERLKKGRKTYCAMVDFSQANDSTNREALWFKLSKMGVSERFLKVTRSMYTHSSFSVRTRKGAAKEVDSTAGLLQGAQNSAALFIHYIADLVKFIEDTEGIHAPTLGDLEISSLLFADDICFLSTTVLGLQKMLNRLAVYCEEWGLRVNVQKTKIIIFKKGARPTKVEKWRYKGEKIEVVRKFKYLGVNFAYNGTWTKHVQESRRKLKMGCCKLAKFSSRLKDCPLKLSLRLLDTLISPAALYGAEIFAWSKGMEGLEALERNHIRAILGLHKGTPGSALNLVLGRVGWTEKAKLRALNYWHKTVTKGKNTLLAKVLEYSREGAEKGKENWIGNVKGQLQRMGLSYIWEKPGAISRKKFKKIVGKRLKDISMQNQMEKTGGLPSVKHLVKGREGRTELWNRIRNLESRFKRRIAFKILLQAHEDAIERDGMDKKCISCKATLRSTVLHHRLAGVWPECRQ